MDSKSVYIKRFFLILTIIWMIVIFSFSNKDAVQSTNTSHTVGRIICNTLIPGFDSFPEDTKDSYIENIDFYVRKAAHATEFMILSILIFLSKKATTPYRNRFLFSWAIASLYAISDEIHQIFVPGRSCQIRDMLIDSTGAIIGMLFIYLIFLFIKPSTPS